MFESRDRGAYASYDCDGKAESPVTVLASTEGGAASRRLAASAASGAAPQVTKAPSTPLPMPSIEFEAGCYHARAVHPADSQEVMVYQRLRYDRFVRQKGWIAPDPGNPLREADHYDPFAQHLAVFQGPDMLAYLRVLPWQEERGFMLDHEFGCLLSERKREALVRDDAVELSRLVVASRPTRLASTLNELHPMELLLKLLYRLSLQAKVTRFYIVVEAAWLKPFARRFGLEFRPLAPPYVFPDGTRTIAAYATLADLEASMLRHSREKYEWYHSLLEVS